MAFFASLRFARTRDAVARPVAGGTGQSRSSAESKSADFTSHLHDLVKGRSRLDSGNLVAQVQKVLICHASVGSGHSRAAQASACDRSERTIGVTDSGSGAFSEARRSSMCKCAS